MPLPYGHAAAAVPFYAAMAVFTVLEQRIRIRSWRDHEGARVDQGTFYVLVACIGAGVAGAFVLASDAGGAAIGFARWPLFVAGMVLIVAGIALRQWSIALLGRLFTFDVRVREGQTVVDRGPYRLVRHPSYTGMLITFAGIGLALGNWLSVAAALVGPALGLAVRIAAEERALTDGLGEPYRRYAARTRRRLIPGVW